MNITRSEIKKQFDRALKLGWLPFFSAAVETHTTGFFDEADLLAIASRETNLDPKWLTKAGDKGNGFGLMQADRRSFPEFTRGDGWKDAKKGILFGARVLMMKWKDTEKCMGQRVTVRSSKGGFYDFVGKKLGLTDLQTVSISAYNCGRWAHYCVSTGRNVDKFSTGSDYSSDVQERAAEFRRLFSDWSQNREKPEPAPIQAATVEPVALTPTEPPTDDFLTSAFDKNVSADELRSSMKTALPSFGARVWQYVARPLVWIYTALEAGNIAAWLGIVVVALILAYIVYLNRARVFKLWEKLKAKVTS